MRQRFREREAARRASGEMPGRRGGWGAQGAQGEEGGGVRSGPGRGAWARAVLRLLARSIATFMCFGSGSRRALAIPTKKMRMGGRFCTVRRSPSPFLLKTSPGNAAATGSRPLASWRNRRRASFESSALFGPPRCGNPPRRRPPRARAGGSRTYAIRGSSCSASGSPPNAAACARRATNSSSASFPPRRSGGWTVKHMVPVRE